MNSYQRDYLTTNLKNEKAVLKYIKLQYLEALKEVNLKISDLLDNPDLQSKIYQRKYQEALRKQLEEIIGKIDNYDTIYEYLNECYINGFVGTLYDIHKQGIPLMIPMNQQQVAYALLHETKLSRGLYATLGWNNQRLAMLVNQEISRGIASALSYIDVARNVQKKFQIGINNAQRIARTEGHRVQTTAAFHAQHHAVDYGCDILKQWDATLDARTRDSHREVDGELREIDEDFSNGLRYPGDPEGRPEEVINCRCALLSRPRWALDKKELDTLKERAAFHGLDKSKQFEDFEKKYLKIEQKLLTQTRENIDFTFKTKNNNDIIEEKIRNVSSGLRNEESLTEKEIEECIHYAKKIGFKDDIHYTDYSPTGFAGSVEGERYCRLCIGTDVKPYNLGHTNNPNQLVSMKGAIAHEVVGHYEAWAGGFVCELDYLEEAQASIRAARFADGLTTLERYVLIRDGIQRLRNNNVKLKDVRHKMRIDRR